MKTKTEIRKRAHAIAEMHFYADVDDKQLWEPFEHYPKEWIREEIANMSKMLARNMFWAQGSEHGETGRTPLDTV